jgi:hypothetical protein
LPLTLFAASVKRSISMGPATSKTGKTPYTLLGGK